MGFVCAACAIDPTSHSLKKIKERSGVTYYYTCPSKATKYNDVDGILRHYDGMLSETTGKWAWIFDGDGFELKHCMEVKVAIALAKLISEKYSATLTKIIVINPTWHVRITKNAVWPFLYERVRSLVVFPTTRFNSEKG
jgi:hypothetical protein